MNSGSTSVMFGPAGGMSWAMNGTGSAILRDRLADERERLAEDRAIDIHTRDALTGGRNRIAEERDQLADKRDRLSAEREAWLDLRERLIDEQEWLANEHAQDTTAGVNAPSNEKPSNERRTATNTRPDEAAVPDEPGVR